MKNATLKTASVLLCVLLILSLSACKKKGSPGSSIMPSSSVPPPNQPVSSSVPEEGEGSQAQSQQGSSSQLDSSSSSSSASSENEVKMQDGTYDGQSQGYNGPVKVTVTVADGKITKVELTEQTETKDVAQQALDEIPARIVEKNTPKVDIVAGATLSSNAIIRAVEDAVEKASQQSGASSSK